MKKLQIVTAIEASRKSKYTLFIDENLSGEGKGLTLELKKLGFNVILFPTTMDDMEIHRNLNNRRKTKEPSKPHIFISDNVQDFMKKNDIKFKDRKYHIFNISKKEKFLMDKLARIIMEKIQTPMQPLTDGGITPVTKGE